MNPLVCDFVEPTSDMRVGGVHVQRQANALESGGQWRDEAPFEIAVEALDLALGLGPIRSANTRAKAILVG